LESKARTSQAGLRREKSRPSFAEDIVKVDVTLAPGLQAKDPSRRPKSATSLDAFRDSAAGALSECSCLPYMGKLASVVGPSRREQRLE